MNSKSDISTCCEGAPFESSSTHDQVKDYYGKQLKTGDDLKTNVCQIGKKRLPHISKAVKQVHEDIRSKYYGCGLIAPEALSGCRVLDLGCGAGLDCFVLCQLVGQNGHVTGLDMTEEQISVGRKYTDLHMDKFGYKKPNVTFMRGFIEKMVESGVKKEHYDVVVSNCVINLCPDKRPVLRNAIKVLKDGGELYFSDVYSDRVVPEEIRMNEILWGECIAGALSWQELYDFTGDVGFSAPFLVEASKFTFKDSSWEEVLKGYSFLSATYRFFKLPEEAKKCTSMKATYMGGIQGSEMEFKLDYKYIFKVGEPVTVPARVTAVLKFTRFASFFRLERAEDEINECCYRPDPFELAVVEEPAAKSGCC